MSEVSNLVDSEAITNKFRELADVEIKNFTSQVEEIISKYLDRLRERVQQEVGVTVTGYASELLENLIAEFNNSLNSVFAAKKDEFAQNAASITAQIVQQIGQSTGVDYISKIEDVFTSQLRPNVVQLVTQFESYASGVVDDRLSSLPSK